MTLGAARWGLVLELAPENVRAAFDALASIGYAPLVPITAQQFGDRDLRETLIREKGMMVLQFYSDRHRETPVDVFVTEPFPFDEEYSRALVKSFSDGPPVRFASVPTLIDLKERADRPEDRMDIHYLRQLLDDRDHG